jgi:uncharacterized lipoprotein YddW (UPF0748 family)
MPISIYFSRALSFIALFAFISDFAFSQLSTIDTKCLWIVRDSMKSKAEIDSAMVYAYQAGFDVVFLQVRGRGDAFYDSKMVSKNHLIDKNFDPLAYATELGHAIGLEVHAWVNCYILWSSKYKPKNKNHLYYTQTDWTESDLHGKMDWRIDLKSPKSPQWEGIYLSPLHPKVNLYLRNVYKELIDNYDIDGIHLDYIRFQDEFYGYNPSGRVEFEKIYNIDPRDIVRGIISTRYGWKQAFVDSMNMAWHSFRQDKVTELVNYIHKDIKNSGKDIKLSAAVKPNIIIARERWFQDWQSWLEKGIIDFVVPMNYFPEIKDFNMSVQIMKNNLSRKELNRVYMGISTYNQDAQSAADKVLMSRLNGFHAVSIFSYDSHKHNLDWFQPVIDSFGSPLD